ncbi:Rpn family recombination-promoting nuclease/putative transposase [Oceanobacillus locisalsi]|uniref:Rpn family recombination-promoting nuclease/putative transposase n=1 Tax=Oceanobacillus locisalsi TaxID=546107 RepID=A0ABW3NA85_9BACI
MNRPHDKLFKETFGDLDVTTNFMHHYLPEEILDIIDIDTLAPQNGSFIESELKDSYSDLLFHVQMGDEEGYLYFLFEHKTKLPSVGTFVLPTEG